MSEAREEMRGAKKLHFSLNTFGKDQLQTPDMSAPTAVASFAVHHASRGMQMQMQKKKNLLKNINSSKI